MQGCHFATDGDRRRGGRGGRGRRHGWGCDVNDVAVGVVGEVERVVCAVVLQLIGVDDATGDHVSDGALITRTPESNTSTYTIH